jgi:hypothetical protein
LGFDRSQEILQDHKTKIVRDIMATFKNPTYGANLSLTLIACVAMASTKNKKRRQEPDSYAPSNGVFES